MKARVGAHHWLLLGILAQMPDMRMHIKMVSKLMYQHVVHIKPTPAVRILQGRGLVTYDETSGWVELTEDGAATQRQKGRAGVTHFVYVPREYMRQP